jgi:intracellular sulfur oxidation DsrE/DsrF family protein
MERRQGTPAAGVVSRRGALGRLGFGVAAIGVLADTRISAAQEATPESPGDFKVVLHASQESHWVYILSNLKNLEHDQPQAKLRVVVDGTAVYTLVGENSVTNELTKLSAGFELQVCPNALREHQIDPAAIPSFATTNLGGVVALVLSNREGFVYIKP